MRFLKLLGVVLIIIVISMFIGGGLALNGLTNEDRHTSFMIYNGAWRVNPVMDLTNTYQRALIAKVGLFALRETEVIYFTAVVDSDGNSLDAQFDYILEGSIPEARYWSYTIYGKDNFLIPNHQRIYGYNQETIAFTPIDSTNLELLQSGQRTYRILISQFEKKGNWLPSGSNDQFVIVLRLYNPSTHVYNNLGSVPLPSIKRI